MKGHKWTKLPDDVPERDDIMMYVETTTGKRTKLYHYGSDVWTSEETGETENSFPAVAAHVTAYARLHLWSLCQKAGKGHYLYCDTDSLIVDATGYANLADEMDDIALGRLKVEQQATEIEILAPKFYRFGEGWKRKGVSKNAVQTDKQTFLSEVFPSFLTQGHWEPDQCFTTHKVTKRFSLKVTDGTRDEQGWIQPITITEMQDVEPVSSILPFDYMMKQDEIRALKDMRRIPPQVLIQLWDYTKGRYKNARNNQGDLVPLEYSKWDDLAPDIGFNNATDLMKGVHRELKLNRDIRDAQYQLNLIDQNPTRPPTPAN